MYARIASEIRGNLFPIVALFATTRYHSFQLLFQRFFKRRLDNARVGQSTGKQIIIPIRLKYTAARTFVLPRLVLLIARFVFSVAQFLVCPR